MKRIVITLTLTIMALGTSIAANAQGISRDPFGKTLIKQPQKISPIIDITPTEVAKPTQENATTASDAEIMQLAMTMGEANITTQSTWIRAQLLLIDGDVISLNEIMLNTMKQQSNIKSYLKMIDSVKTLGKEEQEKLAIYREMFKGLEQSSQLLQSYAFSRNEITLAKLNAKVQSVEARLKSLSTKATQNYAKATLLMPRKHTHLS